MSGPGPEKSPTRSAKDPHVFGTCEYARAAVCAEADIFAAGDYVRGVSLVCHCGMPDNRFEVPILFNDCGGENRPGIFRRRVK